MIFVSKVFNEGLAAAKVATWAPSSTGFQSRGSKRSLLLSLLTEHKSPEMLVPAVRSLLRELTEKRKFRTSLGLLEELALLDNPPACLSGSELYLGALEGLALSGGQGAGDVAARVWEQATTLGGLKGSELLSLSSALLKAVRKSREGGSWAWNEIQRLGVQVGSEGHVDAIFAIEAEITRANSKTSISPTRKTETSHIYDIYCSISALPGSLPSELLRPLLRTARREHWSWNKVRQILIDKKIALSESYWREDLFRYLASCKDLTDEEAIKTAWKFVTSDKEAVPSSLPGLSVSDWSALIGLYCKRDFADLGFELALEISRFYKSQEHWGGLTRPLAVYGARNGLDGLIVKIWDNWLKADASEVATNQLDWLVPLALEASISVKSGRRVIGVLAAALEGGINIEEKFLEDLRVRTNSGSDRISRKIENLVEFLLNRSVGAVNWG